MVDIPEVVVESKEDIEQLKDYGTVYNRGDKIVVATVVGVNETEMNFVYYKE